MLELKNLVVNYGVITALQGISLEVKQGDIVTLIGANGAGKTTTLRAISGLLKVRSGEVLYQGRNITNVPPHQLVQLGIAHVPEGRMVFANLTVHENLMMGAYLVKEKAVIDRELSYVFGIFPRDTWLRLLRDVGFDPRAVADPWGREVFAATRLYAGPRKYDV